MAKTIIKYPLLKKTNLRFYGRENDCLIEYSKISCGIKEIVGVSDVENNTQAQEFVFSIVNDKDSMSNDMETMCPILLFSDRYRKKSGGELLAKFIEDNELGLIIRSGITINPNTGNKIRAYIWHVNESNCRKFQRDIKKQLSKKLKHEEECDCNFCD